MDRLLMTGFDMGAAPMSAYELELRAHIRMVSLTSGGGSDANSNGNDGNGSTYKAPGTKEYLKAAMDFTSGKFDKAAIDLMGDDKSTLVKPSDVYNVVTDLGEKVKNLGKTADDLAGAVAKPTLKDIAKGFKLGISQARLLITGIDWIIKKLFNGYSILDELIKKPFTGDWKELDRAAGQWDSLAGTLPSVASSLDGVASAIQAGAWEGQAADRCAIVNTQVAQVAQAGSAPCSQAATALRALAENAKKAFDFILDLIDEIVSICELIGGEVASIVGTIAIPFTIAYHVYAISDLINRAVQLINNLITAANGFSACASTMVSLAQQANSAKSQLSAAA